VHVDPETLGGMDDEENLWLAYRDEYRIARPQPLSRGTIGQECANADNEWRVSKCFGSEFELRSAGGSAGIISRQT